MIDQNNNINDKDIRDLLKWRLLEQAEDDDVLTQKLIDMEAKLAFSEEALYVPSLQKEKELLEKLANIKPNSIFLKLLLPTVLAVFTIAALLIYNNLSQRSLNASANRIEGQNKNNDLPFVALSDSSKQKENTIIVKDSLEKITQSDTTTTERNEKWMVGDPGIKVDYKTASPKKDSKFVDYDNIPVLTEKQKVENEKQKEKMLKQLMKCDNNYWAIIPTSKEIFPASSIPNTFLMSTTEVTNAQYRVFLYDLLIHDKIEEYIKAVPDSTKWRDKNSYNEPYVRYYFTHPAYNDYPVLNISREGAEMYCNWLTNLIHQKSNNEKEKQAHRQYDNEVRLPTDEEWTIAARGGDENVIYPWGTNSVQNEYGCYLCNMPRRDDIKPGEKCMAVYPDVTTPVHAYNPNKYGLYNLSGNVAEMVVKKDSHIPITKGGGWRSDPEHVKINSEENEGVITASPFIGFRPILTISEESKKHRKLMLDHHIPILSDNQMDENDIQKAKMIKSLIKLNKIDWAYIPMSTDKIYGEVVSVQGFYMATTEVTNNNYRIFLYDLLIHDKLDDYLKAVPDTTKWLISGNSFFEPMRKNYYWHPAYDDYPVLNVTRDGVKMYCDWLTNAANEKKVEMYKMTSSARNETPSGVYMNDLRIPAEEEWMIAARGGKVEAEYPWGTDRIQNKYGCFLCNFGKIKSADNFDSLSGCFKEFPAKVGSLDSDGAFFTAKVMSYNPNDYGLYSISGNAAEMVWQYKTGKPCTKGGSWFSDADHMKISAEPEFIDVTAGSPYIGFRPVFTAKQSK